MDALRVAGLDKHGVERREPASLDIAVSAEQAGQTLAAVVREGLGRVPWSRARALCFSGRVFVDGRCCTAEATRLSAGQRVRVDEAAPRLRRGTLARSALVHVDREVVVVHKRAGLLTVPYAEGDRDTLVDQTEAALRPSQKTSLGVVHRLDKDTSGLLVFARTLFAKRALAAQFRSRTIGRRYVAIVHGLVAGERTFESWLIQNRGDGLRGSFGHFRRPRNRRPKDARWARTRVRALTRLQGATLVECRLETGRQHQIRIHLSEAGHPLVGESVYIRDFRGERLPAPRMLLHAADLRFEHPRDGRPMSFTQPPPEDFARTLDALRQGPRQAG